jgi:hypothetical protein
MGALIAVELVAAFLATIRSLNGVIAAGVWALTTSTGAKAASVLDRTKSLPAIIAGLPPLASVSGKAERPLFAVVTDFGFRSSEAPGRALAEFSEPVSF